MAGKRPVRGRHYLMRLSCCGEVLDGPKDGLFTCSVRNDGTPLILDEGFREYSAPGLEMVDWKEMPEPL